ncbi:hypothetical protein BGZ49_010615 [Haplosporangium sp. Z 27]|nr:hypothetical protein BGZ49_010615 [Haplosporangium sp. Z 27]
MAHQLHPLELHEIRSHIGSFLNTKDLASCVRVSRDWNATFIVFLWRDVTISSTPLSSTLCPLPTIEQIEAHSGLIINLTLKNRLPIEYFRLETLHCLQSITIEYPSRPGPSAKLDALPKLIENHSSSLRYFELTGWSKGIPIRTFVALGSCQNLTSLCFESVEMTVKDLEALLEACAKLGNDTKELQNESHDCKTARSAPDGLVTLRLDNVKIQNYHDDDIFSNITPFTALQHITMNKIDGLDPLAQLRLVMLCPNIKTLYWRGITLGVKFLVNKWAADGIESGMFEHLASVDFLGERIHDKELSRMLKAIPSSLDKLSVKATGFGELAFNTLLSIERHYNFIQDLELFACFNVTSAMTQQIMMTMPALKSFSANHIYCTDILGISDSDQQCAISDSQDWVCKDLRVLRLCIDMGVASDPNTLEYQERQREVHRKLSTLRQIEVLEVSRDLAYRAEITKVRRLDHRLEAGLGYLISLRRLKKFLFKPGQSLTAQEIDWMTGNWETLTTVSRNMNLDEKINIDLVKRLACRNISVV